MKIFFLYMNYKNTSIALATVSFFNEIKREKERFIGLILSKNWYKTHKIAISNHRILAIDKDKRTVTFSLKDYRKDGQRTTMTLTSRQFTQRFQLHILPKGFTRIRHYGFLSSSWKKEKLPLLQLQLARLGRCWKK